MKEIETYLDGDKVTCLLCGREYVTLGGHLTSAHEMRSDDYRELFGIPYGYGFAGKGFRDEGKRRIKRLKRRGIVPYQPSAETMRKMQKARLNRRPITEASRQLSSQRILNYMGLEKAWQNK